MKSGDRNYSAILLFFNSSLGKNLIIITKAKNAPTALAIGGALNPKVWKRIPPIIGAGNASTPLNAANFPASSAL